MSLSDLFEKDIDRRIEGVIKADDETSLATELSEYVLTTEAADHLADFLEEYNSESSNGAWLSGYFGSGKSHLLKMMAVVLENRTIDGVQAVDLFLPKCAGRPELQALIRKAVSIPSKSVLFNIDLKAPALASGERGSILEVFFKVFNESCGYSSIPYIALMERELDMDGEYDAFKKEFENLAGVPWARGRTRERRYVEQVDKAYRAATGSSKQNVLADYKNYSISIEDFANNIKEYMDREAASRPGFRLNFFVDEVGQFVAKDSQRMLNLQTVAEALNTICKRKAWVVVTSQTNLSELLGTLSRDNANDFSKIEARFKIKMPLTGSNVDEVIQRRLLDKKPDTGPVISGLYTAHSGDFGTMFDFADGSKRYVSFKDESDFHATYPFVTYQFDLFRTTMLALSNKEAFSGQYTSVGERSMITICQDALKVLCHDASSKLGSVVPFDYWFNGIRHLIKSTQINQIFVAEHHLNDPLAVRLLKALYLVKYVREFRATPRNLSILLIDDLDANVGDLLRRVQASLAELERQSYLQHVGDCYEYLTDEEKDIDKEIRNLDIAPNELEDLYNDILFGSLLSSGRRIRLADGTEMPYVPLIDEHVRGHVSADLGIDFITAMHPDSGNERQLKMRCFGKDEMLVAIPQDPRLVQDILLFKQTDRYLKQHPYQGETDGTRRNLLMARGEANAQLRHQIETSLKALISSAKIFVSGDEARTTASDSKARIVNAFQELVDRVFSSRGMLSSLLDKTDNDIPAFLETQPALPGMPSLSPTETEVLNFVRSNAAGGKLTTVQAIVDRFSSKPYGWPQAPILCLVARLWSGGHIRCSSNGAELDKTALRDGLLNSRKRPAIVIEQVQQISQAQVRQAKDFAQAFFSTPVAGSEPKDVGTAISALFKARAEELDRLVRQKAEFPFLAALEAPLAECRAAAGKPWTWFFEAEAVGKRTALLSAGQDVIAPIASMFSSGQKDLYAEARQFHEAEKDNFRYWSGNPSAYDPSGSDEEQLTALLSDPDVYKGGRLQKIHTLLQKLKVRGAEARAAIHAESRNKVQKAYDDLVASPTFTSAPPATRGEIAAAAKAVIDALDDELSMASLLLRTSDFVNSSIPGWMSKLSKATAAAAAAAGSPPQAAPRRIVQLTAALPAAAGSVLTTKDDADAWLETLRGRLHAEIEGGASIYVPVSR